jgi:hypothetical protein
MGVLRNVSNSSLPWLLDTKYELYDASVAGQFVYPLLGSSTSYRDAFTRRAADHALQLILHGGVDTGLGMEAAANTLLYEYVGIEPTPHCMFITAVGNGSSGSYTERRVRAVPELWFPPLYSVIHPLHRG